MSQTFQQKKQKYFTTQYPELKGKIIAGEMLAAALPVYLQVLNSII
jgi:hypothetical protein